MINSIAIRDRIEESGLKYKYIASQLGITPYGLSKKLNNYTEFKASEIVKISKLLSLDMEQREQIFFAELVEYKSTTSNPIPSPTDDQAS